MRQFKIIPTITGRDSAALNAFLAEIGRIPLLSSDEEAELACRSRHGDCDARNKLIAANLRFVVSVAKQYQGRGLDLVDLISSGSIGLIRAADKFDETRGFKFISYAVWWVRQSIIQALAEYGRVVRLPLNQVSTLNQINQAISDFEQQHHRRPAPEELEHILNIDVGKIKDTLRLSGRSVSTDAPRSSEEDSGLVIDTLPNTFTHDTDSNLLHESLNQEITRLLFTLDEREADIITCFFGIGQKQGQTLEEIKEKFNLTRERVRQLRDKAIRKLRQVSARSTLHEYLGEVG